MTEPGTASVCMIVLAAGRSSRIKSGRNKLLARFDGAPLVRKVVERAVLSSATRTVVVVGHMANAIRDSLSNVEVTFVHNPDFETGMASSLALGLRAPGVTEFDGVLVLLGDMPLVSSHHLDLMLDCFRAHDGKALVRAAHDGRPGNPVLMTRILYDRVLKLEGDRGASALISSSGINVILVEIGAAASVDVDTIEELTEVGGAFDE